MITPYIPPEIPRETLQKVAPRVWKPRQQSIEAILKAEKEQNDEKN